MRYSREAMFARKFEDERPTRYVLRNTDINRAGVFMFQRLTPKRRPVYGLKSVGDYGILLSYYSMINGGSRWHQER